MTLHPTARRAPRWFTPGDCRLEDFRAQVEVVTALGEYPHATGVEQNVLVHGPDLHTAVEDPVRRRTVQAELAHASAEGCSFPADPGLDQPVGGLAPETRAELVLRCLDAGAEPAEVELRAMARRRDGIR